MTGKTEIATPRSFARFAYAICLVVVSQVKPAPGADLLKFLIEQNEAARERIRSYSYTIEVQWKNETQKERPAYEGLGEVKTKGNYLWSTYRRTGFNRTAGEIQEREMRIVVNDKYTASWPAVGNPIAYRNDHSSFDTIDRRIKTRIRINTPFDFIRYSFGDSVRPLRKATTLRPERTKWDAIEVQDSNAKVAYHIRRFMPTMADPSKPDAIWILDPQKGFLATDLIAYSSNGDVRIHRSMQIREVAPGIWFPVEYDGKRYGDTRPPTATHTLTSWRKAKLKDVKINVDFPAEQFEIGALGLKRDMPDVIVLRTRLDGEKVPYVYLGQALVPQELALLAQSAMDVDRALAVETDATSTQASATPTHADSESSNGAGHEVRPDKTEPAAAARTAQWLVGIVVALIALAVGVARFRARSFRKKVPNPGNE